MIYLTVKKKKKYSKTKIVNFTLKVVKLSKTLFYTHFYTNYRFTMEDLCMLV